MIEASNIMKSLLGPTSARCHSAFFSQYSLYLRKPFFHPLPSARYSPQHRKMTYTGQTPPSTTLDPRVVPFFEKFYEVSDTLSAHEPYANSFFPDADFVMGTKTTKGYDGILELRKGLWSGPIQRRKHKLEKIFPFGEGGKGQEQETECMLYGSVDYGLKNGKEVTVQWAGRAVLADFEGGLRFKLYQVYVVSSHVLEVQRWAKEREDGKRKRKRKAKKAALMKQQMRVRESLLTMNRTPLRS